MQHSWTPYNITVIVFEATYLLHIVQRRQMLTNTLQFSLGHQASWQQCESSNVGHAVVGYIEVRCNACGHACKSCTTNAAARLRKHRTERVQAANGRANSSNSGVSNGNRYMWTICISRIADSRANLQTIICMRYM